MLRTICEPCCPGKFISQPAAAAAAHSFEFPSFQHVKGYLSGMYEIFGFLSFITDWIWCDLNECFALAITTKWSFRKYCVNLHNIKLKLR